MGMTTKAKTTVFRITTENSRSRAVFPLRKITFYLGRYISQLIGLLKEKLGNP
jgi:hypothetical protein